MKDERYRISIELPLRRNYFADYLRWHFNSPGNDIHVSMKSPLGKLFYGMVQVAYRPQPKPTGNNIINIHLPVKDAKRLPTGFHHYPPFVVDQINDLLDFYFDTDFRQYCLVGKEIGMERRHMYESFLKNRNIRNTEDFFERLKKRDYRRRQLLMKLIDENSNDFGYQILKK